MSEPPQRKHVLKIEIQADDGSEIINYLRSLLFDFREKGVRSMAVGGYSLGAVIEYCLNPDQTHDMYVAQLNAYLENEDETLNLD